MKRVLKVIVTLSIILFGLYHIAFFIMPSVTVRNDSGAAVESAKVRLPNSSLDFGSLAIGGSNTIYYELAQADGMYRYQIVFENEVKLEGSCGYVTTNEINKRVVIKLNTESRVVCEGSM